jgi:hypothetical protein
MTYKHNTLIRSADDWCDGLLVDIDDIGERCTVLWDDGQISADIEYEYFNHTNNDFIKNLTEKEALAWRLKLGI